MTAVSNRDHRRVELKRRVLRAAEELFVREGYPRVSMRRIARSAACSVTMLYRLFQNKAEIVEHLLAGGTRELERRYGESRERRSASAFAKLDTILATFVEFALEYPDHYELMLTAQAGGDLADSSRRNRAVWIEAIEAARGEGHFSGWDPEEVYQLLWTSIHGQISLRIRHPRYPWLSVESQRGALLALLSEGRAEPTPSSPRPHALPICHDVPSDPPGVPQGCRDERCAPLPRSEPTLRPTGGVG